MQSPLAEADPRSLQQIFDDDPLNLTDDDIERVVVELRAQRSRWEKAEKAGPKKSKAVAAPSAISAEDLGL